MTNIPMILSPDGNPLRKLEEGDVIQINISDEAKGLYLITKIDPEDNYRVYMEPWDEDSV